MRVKRNKKEKFRLYIGLEDKTLEAEVIDELSSVFSVSPVLDTAHAYDVIHKGAPDMLIIDYALAKINPVDLYDGVSVFHDVPIVLCVSEENYEVTRRVWKKRSIDYILKPFSKQRFIFDVYKAVRHLMLVQDHERLIKELDLYKNALSSDS